MFGCIQAYIRVLLDLLNGGIVELSRVAVKLVEGVVALDTSEGTLVEVAALELADPVQVAVEVAGRDALLEGDDPAVGNGLDRELRGLLDGSSEAAGRSREDSKALEADHDERLTEMLGLELGISEKR